MPIYEYKCQECGVVSEALQRMADPPLTVCERCEGPLKRLISAPAVQFKGTGWYVTDYANKGKDSKDGSKSNESSGSSGSSDSSSSSGSSGSASKSDSGSSSKSTKDSSSSAKPA